MKGLLVTYCNRNVKFAGHLNERRNYITTEFVTLRSMRDLTKNWHFPTAKTTLGCSKPKLILGFPVIASCLVTLNNISSDIEASHSFWYTTRTKKCGQTAKCLML
ncbi:hypothetical protein L2E82_26673 [Cichorium intybus]|uniref:Uncharacterized protein n=1 Tax=Cichorium intybus TaxID=13427 RepID=A0ACB9CQX1_CICIN|nr:hypothetical protein L2E82_26673 [Cichorium intybus]